MQAAFGIRTSSLYVAEVCRDCKARSSFEISEKMSKHSFLAEFSPLVFFLEEDKKNICFSRSKKKIFDQVVKICFKPLVRRRV
jgi:hypothetical protein